MVYVSRWLFAVIKGKSNAMGEISLASDLNPSISSVWPVGSLSWLNSKRSANSPENFSGIWVVFKELF
jgi:hypothetical protein